MRDKITIAFDVGETEIYDRIGKDDAFIARLTEQEACWMLDELRKEIDCYEYSGGALCPECGEETNKFIGVCQHCGYDRWENE